MKILKAVLVAVGLMIGVTAGAVALAAQGGGGGHGGGGRGGGGHGGAWHGGGGHGGGWHGHSRTTVGLGFFVGGPWYWGGYPYYYPPYYSYPAYYPSAAWGPAYQSAYVEQGGEVPPVSAPSAPPQGFWYYCAESQAYYPYVRQCAGAWQRVSPQPPPS